MPKPGKALSGVLPLVVQSRGRSQDGMGGGGERPRPSWGLFAAGSQQWHPLKVWVTPSGNVSLHGWVRGGKMGKGLNCLLRLMDNSVGGLKETERILPVLFSYDSIDSCASGYSGFKTKCPFGMSRATWAGRAV